MHPMATRHDYFALSDDQQEKVLEMLRLLATQRQSCRCTMVGRDFTIIVAPGYASAQWWIDRLTTPTTVSRV